VHDLAFVAGGVDFAGGDREARVAVLESVTRVSPPIVFTVGAAAAWPAANASAAASIRGRKNARLNVMVRHSLQGWGNHGRLCDAPCREWSRSHFTRSPVGLEKLAIIISAAMANGLYWLDHDSGVEHAKPSLKHRPIAYVFKSARIFPLHASQS
jgi:hypothetical protein